MLPTHNFFPFFLIDLFFCSHHAEKFERSFWSDVSCPFEDTHTPYLFSTMATCTHIVSGAYVDVMCECDFSTRKRYVARQGKNGLFLGCQNYPNGCGTKPISFFKCPQCPAPVAAPAPSAVTYPMCKCQGADQKPYRLVTMANGSEFLGCANYKSRANPGCGTTSLNAVGGGQDTKSAGARNAYGKNIITPPREAQRVLASTMHIHASHIFPPINHNNADPAKLNASILTDNHSGGVDAESSDSNVSGMMWNESLLEHQTRGGATWAAQLVKGCIDSYGSTQLKPGNLIPTVFEHPPSNIDRAAIVWFSRFQRSNGYHMPTEVRRGTSLEMANVMSASAESPEDESDGGGAPHSQSLASVLGAFPQNDAYCAIEWNDPVGRLKYGYDFRYMLGVDMQWQTVKIVPCIRNHSGDAPLVSFQLVASVPDTAGWLFGDVDWLMISDGTLNPTPTDTGEWMFIDAGILRRDILRNLQTIEQLPMSMRACKLVPLSIGHFNNVVLGYDHDSGRQNQEEFPEDITNASEKTAQCPALSRDCGTCAGGACQHLGSAIVIEPGSVSNDGESAPLWQECFEKVHVTGPLGNDVHLMCTCDALKTWYAAHDFVETIAPGLHSAPSDSTMQKD